MFQRMGAVRTWIIGSLASDAGSEYLFGYDSQQEQLMWLERSGQKYSSFDAIWAEAEGFIRRSSTKVGSVADMMEEGVPTDPEDQYVVPVEPSAVDRPKTVTKSVVGGGDFSPPRPGDFRIVGDLSPGGEEYDDEDIAGQAAEFLMNLGEGMD